MFKYSIRPNSSHGKCADITCLIHFEVEMAASLPHILPNFSSSCGPELAKEDDLKCSSHLPSPFCKWQILSS